MVMQGRRVYPKDDIEVVHMEPGDYGKDPRDGGWVCTTPNGHLGNLRGHAVVEHEDNTITVSPSILVHFGTAGRNGSWHGYLEKGIWREC